MDVMLGVTVDGDRGQIAMLDAGPGHAVIDEAAVALGEQSVDALIARLIATDRALSSDGHRLVSTRVCCGDPDVAAAISGGLITSGLANVAAVSADEAVSGAMPVHGETAALSLGTGSLAQDVALTGATESLLSAETSAATGMAPAVDAMATGVAPVVDSAATGLAPVLDSAASGPAPAVGDETMIVPAGSDPLLNTERHQLAYSQDPAGEPAGDETAYGPAAEAEAGRFDSGYSDYGDGYGEDGYGKDGYGEDGYGEDGYEAVPEQRDHRPLLIGSTVAAFMIVGFATLAVSVAVSIKPTSSQQAIRLQDDAVPGKYFPVAPGQGVQADGDAWTMIEQAPATNASSTTPGVRTFQPLALGPSTAQTATQAAAKTVQVFPDGAVTVGGTPVQAAAPVVPATGSMVGVGIPGAVPGVIVPRAPILTSLIIGNVLREAVQLHPLYPDNFNNKPGKYNPDDPSGTPGVSSPAVSSPGNSPESTPGSESPVSSPESSSPTSRASEPETTSKATGSSPTPTPSVKQSEPESTPASAPQTTERESAPSSASRSAEPETPSTASRTAEPETPASKHVEQSPASQVEQAPAAQTPVQQSAAEEAPVVQAPVQQAPVSVEQAPAVQAPAVQAPVQQAPVQQAPVQEAPAEAPSRSGRSPSISLPTSESSSGGGIFGGGRSGRGGGIFGGGSGN